MEPINLTRTVIAQSRMIAKGRGIRDVNRLVKEYGGKQARWIKKSSAVVTIDGRPCEIHWYECHGIGRVEAKYVWLDQAR